MRAATNLTGIWQGLYSYPRVLEPVGFVATLIETTHRLSGSTHEAHRMTGESLCAMLSGHRDGSRVAFVKTYEPGARGGYTSDVRYEGTLSEDGSEIEGRWIIRADWSGRFLMIRSTPNAEKIARRKFARA